MTVAALPLLTAGMPLSTTDAANAATQNNSQKGTTPLCGTRGGCASLTTFR